MSQIKSVLYTLFVSRRKRYDPTHYNEEYFEQRDASPDVARCRRWTEVCRPRNVLDVGFGTGAVLKGFISLGVDAHGIEPFKIPANRLGEELKARVQLGSATDTGYPDRSFDLVTCLDVLEHLPEEDSGAALHELVRVSRRWVLLNICYWNDSNARKDPSHINLHSSRWWKRKCAALPADLVAVPSNWPHPRSTILLRRRDAQDEDADPVFREV